MVEVFLKLSLAVRDDRAVTGEDRLRAEVAHPRKRSQVLSERPRRAAEDDRALAGDEVAREQQPLGVKPEAEVVGGVARGLEGDDALVANLDRVAVAQRTIDASDRRVAPDRRA